MKVFTEIQPLQKELNKIRSENLSIGFVPTMGYLHEGHLSLIDAAKKECDFVVLSIFINPLQFGPNEDFDRYPRDEGRDLELAKQHHVDYVFLPDAETMYPNKNKVKVLITEGTDVLCGEKRPGHFEGVATVVTKLFNIVKPNSAYFGLKDAQQFAVIKTLNEQLNFSIHLVGLSTVREMDGLAKSSRNVYLSEGEREEALQISKLLKEATFNLLYNKTNLVNLESYLYSSLNESLSLGKVDYLSILTYPNLNKVEIYDQQIIIAAAVNYEKARLIDNIIIDAQGQRIDRIDILKE